MAMVPSAFFPIADLSNYTKGWTIRARVTSKSGLRTFQSKNNEGGKVFSVELLDCEGGEIKASLFNNAVDNFGELLQVGKCFTFSRGNLKVANRNYSTLSHRYELTFDRDAAVTEVNDDSNIDTMKLHICDLRSVQAKILPANVDLCGVVVSFKASHAFTSKDGKDLVKREIVLADDSCSSMEVTLWSDRAEKEDKEFEGNPVMVIKSVIVKVWGNGRKGSLLETCALLISPSIPEAAKVRQWWSQGGSYQTLTALSDDAFVGGKAPVGKSACLSDIRVASEQATISEEVFSVVCRLAIVQTKKQGEEQPLYYMACMELKDGNKLPCSRRVDSSGFCAVCSRSGRVAPRFNLRCKFSDCEDSTWLTTFHEAAKGALSMEASELKDLEKNREAMEAAIRHSYFQQPLRITIRAKPDNYNGESRTNVTCVDARPVVLREHGRFLLKEISDMIAAS
ncbi:unnamed protein product [Polarella glacialis]|uniref:Replication protein A subunit n=1 Tax=Polarella glacialis TaxID=89957 RepID=A0A813GMT7_POLGL|nr:unnamed protein product [Polarella glacialis]CAE8652162.1 unnamed protein product [Polarella glacialis]